MVNIKKFDVDFKILYYIFMLEYWILLVKDFEINIKVLFVVVEYES